MDEAASPTDDAGTARIIVGTDGYVVGTGRKRTIIAGGRRITMGI